MCVFAIVTDGQSFAEHEIRLKELEDKGENKMLSPKSFERFYITILHSFSVSRMNFDETNIKQLIIKECPEGKSLYES